MKLYTELEVRNAIADACADAWDNSFKVDATKILNQLTPIELPSDEEIAYEVVTWNVYNMTPLEAFRHGVNWTKEQILNQSK